VARIRLALDGGAAVIMPEVGFRLEKKLRHERLRPRDRSTQAIGALHAAARHFEPVDWNFLFLL
jgi:hypothetical protein